MTKDEELERLRQEKTALRDQAAQLSQRSDVLEAWLAKESHTSHLPPSSERFHRQPKSLRKKISATEALIHSQVHLLDIKAGVEQARAQGHTRLHPLEQALIAHPVFPCFLADLKSYGQFTGCIYR